MVHLKVRKTVEVVEYLAFVVNKALHREERVEM